MKTLATLCVIAVFAAGHAAAQEAKTMRFELSAETGKPGVLSGPEVKDASNAVFRFGYFPTREFQLTLTYTKWDGIITSDDSLANDWAQDFNREQPPNQQVDFTDAILDDRDVQLEQLEIGIVKTIPAGKHWEGFVGLGLGTQNAKASVSWRGPAIPPGTNTDFDTEVTNEFLTSVRGGMRFVIVDWLALQANLKWVPIGKIFGKNYNGVELNGGIAFRFGRF